MKLNFCLIILTFVFFSATCDPRADLRLELKNNSPNYITIIDSPDTIFNLLRGYPQNFQQDSLSPNEKINLFSWDWNADINESTNKKLNIFIVIEDTIQKYNNDWKYIRDKKLYKRYSYTLEELEKTKWIIEYP